MRIVVLITDATIISTSPYITYFNIYLRFYIKKIHYFPHLQGVRKLNPQGAIGGFTVYEWYLFKLHSLQTDNVICTYVLLSYSLRALALSAPCVVTESKTWQPAEMQSVDLRRSSSKK